MYLDRLMGTSTKINVLSELVASPKRSFVERELAGKIGMAASGVNHQIAGLVECGVVRMEKVGRANTYRINERHFLFPALRRIFTDLNTVYRRMAGEIAKYAAARHKLSAVILMGSAARGSVSQDYVGKPSDIDLVIVGDDPGGITADIVGNAAADAFERYGVNCYPVVMTEGEYKKRLGGGDPFILQAQAEGEVLYGKKPRSIG